MAKIREFLLKINLIFGHLLYRKFYLNPFGNDIRASRETYLRLHKDEQHRDYPEVNDIEAELGYSLDRDWFETLALHTQVVVKKNPLNYQHGRLLYAFLRDYIAKNNEREITILETGTSRGFSSLCMAKALSDANQAGKIITIDVLPHDQQFYWNCIDDHERKKSRREILEPWQDLLDRIVFIQGNTLEVVNRIAMNRVHFAFLDAQHEKNHVLREYNSIRNCQFPEDVVFFDDYTPQQFPGVVAAVDAIMEEGRHEFRKIRLSDYRGYVFARQK